ncbi:glycosyltransferase family 4 protein [Candidatus Gracilibacteria bacterium]|nr:glycosyltransferase family 4 protein [Candidatus Gracilibacteria bacterium]
MKIAIDIRSAAGEKAGKGWYTFHIVQNLLKLDQKNEYILYSKDPVPGFGQFPNAQIKGFKSPGILWHYAVARDAKKENVDYFFAPSSYIIPSLLHKSIKSIITVHDLVAFLYPNKHNKKATILEKIFLKKALKKSHHVLTVSNNTKDDLLQRFQGTEDKISVVPCAADPDYRPIKKEALEKFTKQTNLPEKFFLAVGTIEPRKNYETLIKAFSNFAHHHPEYHLVIVGKEGWKFQPVYEEINKNYLNKKVHILGYLSNSSLQKLYNLATALVFPSHYEGFGIPPLEAMQSGCPVISSSSSSMPEVVGDCALLCKPGSVEDFTSAMLEISANPELRAQLIAKGLERAKKFSWKGSAKKVLELMCDGQNPSLMLWFR